jgi:hypothetical protein
MGRKVLRISGAVIASLGFVLGVPLAQQTQTAPTKGPLEVTYYFLPG